MWNRTTKQRHAALRRRASYARALRKVDRRVNGDLRRFMRSKSRDEAFVKTQPFLPGGRA